MTRLSFTFVLVLVLALALVLAASSTACTPRRPLDACPKLLVAPVTVAPALLPEGATVSAVAEDLRRAYVHYLREGGLFEEVGEGRGPPGAPIDPPDGLTVVLEAKVLDYVADGERAGALRVLGGRGRGHAVVRHWFRSAAGMVAIQDIRSISRAGPAVYTGVPPPLGGIDATIEGAAAHLHWWLARNKSPARPSTPAPPSQRSGAASARDER